jgi:hypothetical protein
MQKQYHLRKIYTLLIQSFTETQLRDFCKQMPDFHPVCGQLTIYSSKDDILRQIFEYARQADLFDVLLEWARIQNPEKFAGLQPYYEETETQDEYLGQYRLF